jgi:hypothetical protein
VLIVAVTGWGQDQDKKRALGAGFDAHITKPAEMEALERILTSVKHSGTVIAGVLPDRSSSRAAAIRRGRLSGRSPRTSPIGQRSRRGAAANSRLEPKTPDAWRAAAVADVEFIDRTLRDNTPPSGSCRPSHRLTATSRAR